MKKVAIHHPSECLRKAGMATMAFFALSASLTAASPDGLVWTQETVSPISVRLRSVSAASRNFVVTAGSQATLLLKNGEGWQDFPGWSEFVSTNPAWSGGGTQPPVTQLSGVLAISENSVWVSSMDPEWPNIGRIAHWDGTTWSNVDTANNWRVYGLWGKDDSLIVGGRQNGYITRVVDGSPLLAQNTTLGIGVGVLVGGSGADNLWAVGTGGLRHSSDGGANWSVVNEPADLGWNAVYSRGANQTWVGSSGNPVNDVYFYNGTEFTSLNLDLVGHNILGIYAKDENNVWAVGSSGFAAFYNGSSWESLNLGFAWDLTSITEIDGEMWISAANGVVFHGIAVPEGTTLTLIALGMAVVGYRCLSNRRR